MRALANLSHEGNKLAKRPRDHVITGLLQFELLCGTITEKWDQHFYGYQPMLFSLGKNRQNAKACSIKSDLSVNNDVFQTGYELKTFLWHRLGAESPTCLVSRSQTACAWQKPSGYARLAISCLGGRTKCSTRGKGFENITFLTLRNFFSFSALCNSIKWDLSIKSQTIVWIATIITIAWLFTVAIYSSW